MTISQLMKTKPVRVIGPEDNVWLYFESEKQAWVVRRSGRWHPVCETHNQREACKEFIAAAGLEEVL